ncbi:MAG: hypothetical protein ACD_55C00168G0001 [uncultured bacterium]|nr:MAG: hypothetical protein ACD_55C00168G0001 [uncultured bacterium]
MAFREDERQVESMSQMFRCVKQVIISTAFKNIDIKCCRKYLKLFLVSMRRLHKQRLLPKNVERRQWVDQGLPD